jgi:hypothetical protein
MLDALAGWKTYLIFAATLVLAVGSKLGWADADSVAVQYALDLLTNPVVLSILALIMRKVTDGPASV